MHVFHMYVYTHRYISMAPCIHVYICMSALAHPKPKVSQKAEELGIQSPIGETPRRDPSSQYLIDPRS